MAIPSRQIGWGTEENLLWQISKQLEAINGVAYNSGGGGGTGTSGTSGASFGTSGTSGLAGTAGTSGQAGTSGSAGTSGVSGTNGSSGTAGVSGTAGTAGIAGTAGTSGANGAVGGYLGSFYDTTNQTGVAGSVLTMGLSNSDSWNNGVSLVSGNRITIVNPGVYSIAFSAQMVKNSGNTATHAHIWLSQNGTDVPTSASQIGFPSNSVYIVAAWNFFFKTTVVNEYVQLKWEINSNVDNGLVITSALASGNVPAIPGLIVTVNQVG
jgi:hypothetical protein